MKYHVTLNGKVFEVEVDACEAAIVQESTAPAAPAAPAVPAAPAAPTVPAAPAAPAASGGETVDSPLPGTVLSIQVKNGQAVKAGDILLVLEAMKMENEILAPRDCVVSQVLVAVGNLIETGTPLVVLS